MRCRTTGLRAFALAAALPMLLAGGARAAEQAADSAAQVLQAACADALQAAPAELDLDRAEKQAEALHDRGDPAAFTLSCRAWQVAQLRHGADHELTLRWASNLGVALFMRRQPDAVLVVLADVWARADALGDATAHLAVRAAAVLASVHQQRQQMDDALRWSTRAMARIDHAGQPLRDQLRMKAGHAALLSMVRRDDEAILLLAQLEQVALKEPDERALELMMVYNLWAVALRRAGRKDEAFDVNERGIAVLRGLQPAQAFGLALALHNRGLLQRGQARFAAAEASMREALDIASRAQGADVHQARASIRDSLSSLLVSRGQVAEGLALARDAVALVDAGPEAGSGAAVRPLRRLAEAQAANGDLAGALATWRRALAIIQPRADAGDAETRNLAWMSFARLKLQLGDTADAQWALDQLGAELAGRPMPWEERAGLARLHAGVARRAGQLDQSLLQLARADAELAQGQPPGHPDRVRVAIERCQLGRGCEELARRTDLQGLPTSVESALQLAMARHLRLAGETGAAESRLRLALEAAHAAADPALQWQVQAEYSVLLATSARWAEAAFFGKRALDVVERLRSSAAQAGQRTEQFYLADKAPLYRHLADVLLRQSRLAEAMEVLRRLKRSEVDDYNERAAMAGPELSLTPQEQLWQRLLDEALAPGRELAAEILRLRELARQQRIEPQEQRRLDELLVQQAESRQQAQARLDQALAQARRSPAPPGRSRTLAPAPAGELRAWLLQSNDDLLVVLSSARRQWVQRLPDAGGSSLANLAAAALDALQRGQPLPPGMHELLGRLGALLARSSRAEQAARLLLWLDGPLRYLPPALLHDGGQSLIERFPIAISGQDFAMTSARAVRPAERTLQAWGATQSHQGMPALPGVADELCRIVDGPVRGLAAATPACQGGEQPRGQGPWQGQADADARFTEAGFEAAAGRAALVHIGTHFVLRPGNVSRSWLLLGDGQRLTLQRLQQMPLGEPELVTLSACDSAVPGQGADGREIDGLAATWLAKGARAVLASLWRVDDRSTARLMGHFYRALARPGTNPAAALREAQLELKADRLTAAPRHWAAFVLIERS